MMWVFPQKLSNNAPGLFDWKERNLMESAKIAKRKSFRLWQENFQIYKEIKKRFLVFALSKQRLTRGFPISSP